MRRAISSFAAIGAVLLMAVPAQASGAGAVSITQNMHDVTVTFPVLNPCNNQPGTVTETYNAVFHITSLENGTFWVTFTISGDITLVQTNGVIYDGHMTGWDGFNGNLQNFTGTETFIVTANGSDGTHIAFHAVAHITVLLTSPPTVVVQFMMGTCN